MIFTPTPLAGAYLLELERFTDERGFFARAWCQQEFEDHGLNPRVVQCNVSFNPKRHTLRGLHYQEAPHAEAKLVRCTRGAIYDVVVDLRRDSPTFTKWVGFELTPDNGRLLYAPEGFAHGYLTLADDTEVTYQVSASYHPSSARGVRWNDPVFSIAWPATPHVILPRDNLYPDFRP